MDKLTFLTQHLQLLAELSEELQKYIKDANEGANEKSVPLIMGSLQGLDRTVQNIKSIYATMLYVCGK